jgi:putative ABC transport system ATP-binding protein
MLLNVEKLLKSFRSPEGGQHRVVDIESFQLAPRQQLALSGESGSGKTTFLHLIAGILKADSGIIRLNGAAMTELDEAGRDRLRAKSLGYIFQTFNLLQGYTCLENVLLGMAFGPGADRDFAQKLLQRVGIGQKANYYPRQLSVGQQQRVAVARALANRPRLVLADEPTGNLDRANAREALRLIREACDESEAALLLVSHDHQVLNEFEHRVDLRSLNRAAATEEGK